MRLDSAIARLASRMGLSLPMPSPSPADRTAFDHHIDALSAGAISPSLGDHESLLKAIGDPSDGARSEEVAQRSELRD